MLESHKYIPFLERRGRKVDPARTQSFLGTWISTRSFRFRHLLIGTSVSLLLWFLERCSVAYRDLDPKSKCLSSGSNSTGCPSPGAWCGRLERQQLREWYKSSVRVRKVSRLSGLAVRHSVLCNSCSWTSEQLETTESAGKGKRIDGRTRRRWWVSLRDEGGRGN